MNTRKHPSLEHRKGMDLKKEKESGAKGQAQFSDQRSEVIVQRKLHADMATRPRDEDTAQLRSAMESPTETQSKPMQRKGKATAGGATNKTGLPDQLKSGVEKLSGYSLDDVKVHYNSSKPAQLKALAYAQGSEIHLGPGQEKSLAHEAWHVVQQKQGRVKPTMQFKGKVNINDDVGLETEADVMGEKALQAGTANLDTAPVQRVAQTSVIQCDFGEELEREIAEFVNALDRVLQENEVNYSQEFRLIEMQAILEDIPPEIERAFFAFINGDDLRTAGLTVVEEIMVGEIKKLFGYDKVDEMKRKLFGMTSSDERPFKTKGQFFDYFKANGYHRRTYDDMIAKYGNAPGAEGYLKEVIESGKDVPVAKPVTPGQKFYKLMAPDAKPGYMQSYSPYYVTWEELMNVLAGVNLADHLGLPIGSYSAVYNVYEITATPGTTVYESTIAPTEQPIKHLPKKFSNSGGRKQTLILDSMSGAWTKTSQPTHLLDPNEVELAALGRAVEN